MTDEIVPVAQSLDYAKALRAKNIPCEMHIFPEGGHGMGLAMGEGAVKHCVAQWRELLLRWLQLSCFIG